MIKRYWLALFSIVCVPLLSAQDNVDRFILPETPPTIERLEKPSIDRPFLKKQNFTPEADISSSPIWQKTVFKPFDEASYPAWVKIGGGAYRTASVESLYTSQAGSTLHLGHSSSDGEAPVLASGKTFAGYLCETQFGGSFVGEGSLDFLTRSLNSQKKDLYSASYSLSWYPMRNFNMKARAGWVYATVEAVDKNDSVNGEIEGNWQPFEGDNLMLKAAATRDTAFNQAARDYKLDLVNELFLPADMMAGLGVRYQQEQVYPLARVAWRPFSRGRISVSYEPGMVQPDWAKLYVSDKFVSVNNALSASENIFSLKEAFSYYWAKQGEGNIEFYQERQRKAVYWSHLLVTNTITPVVVDDIFRSGCRIKINYKGDFFRPECSVDLTAEKGLPFTPRYMADIKLGLHYGEFTLTPSLNAADERVAAIDSYVMRGYAAVSCELAWEPRPDVTLAVECVNISAEPIESQPGFVQRLPMARGSIEFRF
jgi:hypothetical protein